VDKRYIKWMAVLLSVVMVFAVTTIGCEPAAETPELKVYTWAGADYVNFWNNPLDPYGFYNVYAEDEVDVNFDYMIDIYDAFSKMAIDPKYTDVVQLTTRNTEYFYERDPSLLAPLDTDLLPCWDEMYPVLQTLPGMWYGDDLVAVPCDFGYTMIIYRSDLLEAAGFEREEFANNLSFIFKDDERLEGKFFPYDSGMESSYLLTMAAGVDPDDIWPQNMDDFNANKDMLVANWTAAADNIGGFWTGWEEGIDILVSGQAWIIIGWLDTYVYTVLGLEETLNLTDGREAVGFMAPEGGVVAWCEVYSVRDGLEEEDPFLWEAAHTFMNAHLSPLGGVGKIEYWNYGVPNMASANMSEPMVDWLIDEFYLDDPETAFEMWNFTHIQPYEIHEEIMNLWDDLKTITGF